MDIKKQYKKIYTREEMAELTEWFNKHQAEIPTTLQLNNSTYFSNLPQTIESLFNVYKINGDSPTFSGQYFMLFQIRHKLIELGMTD